MSDYFKDKDSLINTLQKPREEFTKSDLIRYIYEKKIDVLNLCYPGADGRLKKLNFPAKNPDYLNLILETGERLDGSSLFPYIDVDNSDTYVIPRYSSAFIDFFGQRRALNVMCSYFGSDGKVLDICPHNILRKISQKIKEETGFTIRALGEIEYYLIMDLQENLFPSIPQKNYHESAPFVKGEKMREEILAVLSESGINVKYAHSEVGEIPSSEKRIVEQHEIELLPMPIEIAAEQIMITKWVIRNIAAKWGVFVTFAPKIEVGYAGSGLHVHLLAEKEDTKVMTDEKGELSPTAKQMIGGLLKYAKSLTAFGNNIPTSFLRLVPNQEAPTKICWGERNRCALIRVPLGWKNTGCMAQMLNFGKQIQEFDFPERQTFEIRSPDASAHSYHLLAALGATIYWGLSNQEESLELAKNLYVKGNIFKDKEKGAKYSDLPSSCSRAAVCLEKEREIYEIAGFPKTLIDGLIQKLKAYEDENIIWPMEAREKLEALLKKHIHCG